MTNKISGYGSQPLVGNSARGGSVDRPTGSETAGKEKAAASRGDTVTLTESARALARLSEAVAKAPVSDAARVDALKDAVSTNTYQVNAERVAEKMLAADRELAGR